MPPETIYLLRTHCLDHCVGSQNLLPYSVYFLSFPISASLLLVLMEGKDIAFPHHRIYHREFQAGLHTVLSSVPSHCSDLDYFSFSFCFFFFTGTIFQHHIYFLFASHSIYVLLRDIPGLAKVSWWYGLRMPVSGQFVDQQLPHPGGHILWVH